MQLASRFAPHSPVLKAEAKRIAKLEDRQAELQERLDDENEDMTDEQAQALHNAIDELGSELEAIERQLVEYSPAVVALAGAVVSLNPMGGVVVHRGLLREEQAKTLQEQARQKDGAACSGSDAGVDDPAKPGISEKLAKRLSAHRTAALQAEVARHPHVALVAVVHRLALRVIVDSYGSGGSPVDITATPQDGLGQHAPDIGEAPAAVGMRKVRDAWADRLPGDPDALFAELLAFRQQELLSLLAVCVASTVSALASHEEEVPAAALAQAVNLDMHDWWTPTAAGYFEHVSKAKVLEAVLAFAPDQVNRLGKLKKAEIASEAERLAVGTGWLPVMFRGQEAAAETSAAAEGQTDAGSSGGGESEDQEDMRAVA